jgi:phage terminase large subunit-like protein
MVLFRDAVAMYQQSPELQVRLTTSGAAENIWNLAYRKTGSFFRAISADEGQSGPRPHVALIDEVHEHKTAVVVEMMRAGTKSRRQALIFMITNSGAGANTPCGMYHDYACEIAAGKRKNGQPAVDDAFFSYVCALDEGEDPLTDESCWHKANPSLQFANLPGLQYLREQVTEARGMPAKEAIVRRLNFCEWTAAINPWLSAHVWDPCRAAYTVDDLRGRRAYAGLDLSATTDLTAFVLLVEPLTAGDPWSILPWCWLPEEGLADRAERDRVDYVTWKKQGHLETTPGRAISKRHVLQRVAQICAQFDVLGISADRWRLEEFRQQAADEGIELPEMVPFGQGFKDMSPAIDAFETALLNRNVRHNGHPVLTACAANAVTTSDPAGNRKLDKIKATGRIDLVVAAVMAYASVSATPVEADLSDFLNSPVIA